jgi:hypothetical protein
MPFASVRLRGVIGRLIFMFCSRMALWPGDARTARGGVHEMLASRRGGAAADGSVGASSDGG